MPTRVTMGSVDLEDATNELYALSPADFTARRTALVAQARAAKQTEVAKAVSELRRPTVAAWLLNQLARGEQGSDEEIEQLETLGRQLREAQAQLDGPRMKELTRPRQQLIAALVRRAGRVAAAAGGQKVSGSVQRELEETLGAAVADEQASHAVLSGRLTRALVYAGLGEVDVTEATATPIGHGRRLDHSRRDSRRPRPEVSLGKGGSPEGSPGKGGSPESSPATDSSAREDAEERARESARAERERAVHAAEEAAALFATAEDELAASAQRRDQVLAQESELGARLDELQREILRTRHELDAVSRKVAAAERDHQRQERETRDARKAAQRAEQAVASREP